MNQYELCEELFDLCKSYAELCDAYRGLPMAIDPAIKQNAFFDREQEILLKKTAGRMEHSKEWEGYM